ncbi:HNH endonuclease [Haloferax sp. Atlit-12N]|uniref:HNH endonuclease n=1 Tax=Haloferax sp. Atlit-12N TaxID=2077203 RepID=UPI000E281A53|nr:HNH endonuclease [Haloferax sp. Atlit-12N]
MECPSCGKQLATEQGMRQHHTKVHNTPLPNRVCKRCHQEFYDPKSQRVYCEECYSEQGNQNGNWRGGKETETCSVCDATFSYYPSNKQGVYCSECVKEAEGLLPENPAERIELIRTACSFCEAQLERLPSSINGNEYGSFCDLDCYGKWLSNNIVGSNHHQWEGGTLFYGESWWPVRRKALERDNYTCQRCGADSEELGQNPDVHHLNRVRDFDDPSNAHTLSNVVSLCRSCHRLVESGDKK